MSASPRRCCRPRPPRASPPAAASASSRPLLGPQDARGVRLHFPALGPEDRHPAPRPARLPRRQGERRSCSARPAPARHICPLRSGSGLPRRPPRLLRHRHRIDRPPRRRPTRRPPRARAQTPRPHPAADRRRIGYIPLDPEAANLMFTLVSAPLRARQPDRHLQQGLLRLGRNLRRRHRRRRHDRPARPPRRDHRTQRRQLHLDRHPPRRGERRGNPRHRDPIPGPHDRHRRRHPGHGQRSQLTPSAAQGAR